MKKRIQQRALRSALWHTEQQAENIYNVHCISIWCISIMQVCWSSKYTFVYSTKAAAKFEAPHTKYTMIRSKTIICSIILFCFNNFSFSIQLILQFNDYVFVLFHTKKSVFDYATDLRSRKKTHESYVSKCFFSIRRLSESKSCFSIWWNLHKKFMIRN